MKLTTLLENDRKDKKLIAKHGLSYFIETKGLKVLFDLGPDKSFMKNAKQLNINLKEVDYVVISHGHFDHGKYLNEFLEYNNKAKVIISKHAFEKHFFKLGPIRINIGLNQPKQIDRFVFVDKEYELEKGIMVTSLVDFVEGAAIGKNLYMNTDLTLKIDEYQHEIYLMIEEEKKVLLSGCSHKGIGNIVRTLEKKYSTHFDAVIGGFHLMNYNPKKKEQKAFLTNLGNELNDNGSVFYTCHCTGEKAFDELSKNMKKLYKLNTGDTITL